VIGVVNDFYTSSLHNKIQPLIMTMLNEWGDYGNIIIRTSGLPFNRIEENIETIFLDTDPGNPFSYIVLEDSLTSLYAKEKNINILFLVLSIVAILVSCLGLYGLATFSIQIRKREIGIRKVNGARITDILSKFSKELLIWIVLAFIIAAPVCYFVMTGWLANYAYKVNISIWMLLFAGFIVLIIGLISIGWALLKEVLRNPVELLRF